MIALLGTVFVASLAGSLHCAGMCGGFVAFYAPGDRRHTRAHLAYNGGRLMTYVVLGVVFGGVGAAVNLAGSLAGVRRIAAPAAGSLMVLWGTLALWQAIDARGPRLAAPRWLTRWTGGLLARLGRRPPLTRALLLGLLSTLLPCGWLYGFATLAAGTGNPGRGAAVMAAFWAGTVPMMLGLGVSLQALSVPLRRRLPAITALAMIAVGMFWLAGRTGLAALPGHAGHGGHATTSTASDAPAGIAEPDPVSSPDCCPEPTVSPPRSDPDEGPSGPGD